MNLDINTILFVGLAGIAAIQAYWLDEARNQAKENASRIHIMDDMYRDLAQKVSNMEPELVEDMGLPIIMTGWEKYKENGLLGYWRRMAAELEVKSKYPETVTESVAKEQGLTLLEKSCYEDRCRSLVKHWN